MRKQKWIIRKKILSKEDVGMLRSRNVDVPDKELSDIEWNNFLVQIVINLKQEESERIIDILDDNAK